MTSPTFENFELSFEWKVQQFDFGSQRLDSLYLKSKYRDNKGFLEKRKGHIVLQK